ncbi:Hypothetical protein POVN_LOCUS55 [uncultured virus]|nr:Hypothetical protein POVN_LOCUS55 [uncultured virus]
MTDSAPVCKTIPHFTKIKEAIATYLRGADTAYVCSAWFSCPHILEAMASLSKCELLVSTKPPCLHELKEARIACYLHVHQPKFSFSVEVKEDNERSVPSVKDDVKEYELMHNKFIVLLKEAGEERIQTPYAVITGSYNFTKAADTNAENIVYIPDSVVAAVYLKQFFELRDLCTKL